MSEYGALYCQHSLYTFTTLDALMQFLYKLSTNLIILTLRIMSGAKNISVEKRESKCLSTNEHTNKGTTGLTVQEK